MKYYYKFKKKETILKSQKQIKKIDFFINLKFRNSIIYFSLNLHKLKYL